MATLPNVAGITVANWPLVSNLNDISGNGLNLITVNWATATTAGGVEQYDVLTGSENGFKFNGATKLLAPASALLRLTGPYTIQFTLHQVSALGGNQVYFCGVDPAGRSGGAAADRIGSLFTYFWANGPSGAMPYYTDQHHGSGIGTSDNHFPPAINPFAPPGVWGITVTHYYAFRVNADGTIDGFIDGVKYPGPLTSNNTIAGTERFYIGGCETTFTDVLTSGCLMGSTRIVSGARSDADILSDYYYTAELEPPTVRSVAAYITDTTLYRPFYYLKITGLPYYFFAVIDPTDSQYGVSAWTLADGYTAVGGMDVPRGQFDQSLNDIIGGIASAERTTLDLMDFKVVDTNGSHSFFGRLLSPGRFTANTSAVFGDLTQDIGPTDAGEVLIVKPRGGAFAADADTYVGGETMGISTVTPGAGTIQQIFVTDRNKYPCHSGYPPTPFYRVQADPTGAYNPAVAGLVSQGGPITFVGRSAALYIGHLLPDGRPEPEASSLCRMIGHVKGVTAGREPGRYSIEIESVMKDLDTAKVAPQLAHSTMLGRIHLPTTDDRTIHFGVVVTNQTSGSDSKQASFTIDDGTTNVYDDVIAVQRALNAGFRANILTAGTAPYKFTFYCSPAAASDRFTITCACDTDLTGLDDWTFTAWIGRNLVWRPPGGVAYAPSILGALGYKDAKRGDLPLQNDSFIQFEADLPLPVMYIPGNNIATIVPLAAGQDANGQRFFTDQGDGSAKAYVRFGTGHIGQITAQTTSSITVKGLAVGASSGSAMAYRLTPSSVSAPLYLTKADGLDVDQVIHIDISGENGTGDQLFPRLLSSKGYSEDGEYNVYPPGVGVGWDGILDKDSFRALAGLVGIGVSIDIDSTTTFKDLWTGYAKERGLFLVWDPEVGEITLRQISMPNFAAANTFTFSESNRATVGDMSQWQIDYANLRMSWTFKYGWDPIEKKFTAAEITINDPFAMQAYQQASRVEVIEDRLIPGNRMDMIGDVLESFVGRLRYTQQPWAKITRTVNKRGLLLSPGRYHKVIDANLINPFTGNKGIDSDDELYGFLYSVRSNLSDGSVQVVFLIDQTTDQTTIRPWSPTGLVSFAAASNGYNNATGVVTMDDRFRSTTTGGQFDGIDFLVGDTVAFVTYDNIGAPVYEKTSTITAVATNGSTVTVGAGLGAFSSTYETIMVIRNWASATTARRTGASRVSFQGDGDALLINATDRLHKWS